MPEESENLESRISGEISDMEKGRRRALMEHFDEAMRQVSFTNMAQPDAGRIHPGVIENEEFEDANKTKYEYSSLDHGKKQIRLLMVAPAEDWGEPIQCGLLTESFDKLPCLFEILSYCWGDPFSTVPIYINGCVHYITINLASFLRRRRNRTEPYILWVDALCINQSDNKEKERQVGMMRSIYERATVLHIWIGDESSDSNLAMDLIRQLGRPGEEKKKVWIMSDDEIFALENLFQRGWWNRIWIVQELVNGGSNKDMKTRLVLCGWTALPWDYIARAVSRLNRHNKDTRQNFRYLESILGLEMARRISSCLDHVESSYLLGLLDLHRAREATDARDKVYGLMGLANPDDAVYRAVNVDYGKSAGQLFADVAISAIKITSSLDILRRCHRTRAADIPSWAPDWSTPCGYKSLRTRYTVEIKDGEEDVKDDEAETDDAAKGVVASKGDDVAAEPPRNFYNAAKASTPEFEVSVDRMVLSVKGVLFDQVKVIQDPFPENIVTPWENCTHFMNLVARCKAAARESGANSNLYSTFKEVTIAFWHTLFADHSGYGEYPASLYSSSLQKDIKKQYACLQEWLSPIPESWTPSPPTVTETSAGRLHVGTWAAYMARFFNGDGWIIDGEGSGMKSDFLPTTWSAQQLEERTKEFISLAKTWESGRYDLLKSPFHLPNVVPDPFLRYRSSDPIHALMSQVSDGLPGTHEYALGRRFIITEKGYMGLAPPECEEGDKIAILFGSDVPFVLRRSTGNIEEFELVGEAHVQDIMDGEVIQLLDAGGLESRTFRIV